MKHIHILITEEDNIIPSKADGNTQVYEVNMRIEPNPADAPDIDARLSSIFLVLGIPANMKGYLYLRESVKLVIQSPEYMNCITKKLYPVIADRFGSTPRNVEHAIRHAIEICWQRGRVDRLNDLYGFRVVAQADKPSNSELIALIADRILAGRET